VTTGDLLGNGFHLLVVEGGGEVDARPHLQTVALEKLVGVGEMVLTAIVGRDEPEPLLRVESLDRARHLAGGWRRLERRGPCVLCNHAILADARLDPRQANASAAAKEPPRRWARWVHVTTGDLLGNGFLLGDVEGGGEVDAQPNLQTVALEKLVGVHEEVLAAAVGRDEPKALLLVECLDGARRLAGGWHRLERRGPCVLRNHAALAAAGRAHAERRFGLDGGHRAVGVQVAAGHLLRDRLGLGVVILGHERHSRADGQRVALEQVDGVDEVVVASVHGDEAEAPLDVEGLDGAPHHAGRHHAARRDRGRADASRGRCPREGLRALRGGGQPPHHPHGGRWREPRRGTRHAARVGVRAGDFLRDGLHLGRVVRWREDDTPARRQRVAVE